MNDINVPNLAINATEPRQHWLDAMVAAMPGLPPALRKAAVWLLENSTEIAFHSTRKLAVRADVHPNTLIRLARVLGAQSFEDIKADFISSARADQAGFPDRARRLQDLSADGQMGRLFEQLRLSAAQNIEESFDQLDASALEKAADVILQARRVLVLGVGINHTLARNFVYLAEMAGQDMQAVPRDGSMALDDVMRADSGDVLLAMTFKPYRVEVVEAVELARQRGVQIIAISDSPASPIFTQATCCFSVGTDSPQFFPSTFATIALLEALMAFVIAKAGPNVVTNIELNDQHRQQLGLYVEKRDER